VLSAADAAAALSMEGAIAAQREAFGQLAAGQAVIPLRAVLPVAGGTTLFMPGYLRASGVLGLKVVSVMPGNPARDLPAVPGATLLLDDETGLPVALLDAAYLTALRTAAGSGLATDLLAPPDAHVLAVFGAGAQARQHIRAIRAVRPIREVRIVSRREERSRALASELTGVDVRTGDDPGAAVAGAQVVVTATNSASPVFPGAALDVGAHVCAIGAYTPQTREVDEEVVCRARIVVDTREGALSEAGDLLIPMERGLLREGDIDAELGELVNGERPPGNLGRPVTFYKSVGNAAQDLATAHRVVEAARSRGLGTLAPL
jgi:ornithine cyclodeaminase